MFGMFGMSDYALIGEKIPENSKRAVYDLFSRHYNVRRVTREWLRDSHYVVELNDGRYLNVAVDTGYTLMNRPYTYIRSIS